MTQSRQNEARPPLAAVVAELRALQSRRSRAIRSRIALANELRANVANTMGYTTRLGPAERKALFKQAQATIDARLRGKEPDHPAGPLIDGMGAGVRSLEGYERTMEKAMLRQVRFLPEYLLAWLNAPEQRGFGEMSLATLIGEAGDLNNYDTISKLWRRMGCAPWPFGGRCHMGSTWRAKKSLPAEEWVKYGYNKHRRSVLYAAVEPLVRANGHYKAYYDQVRKEVLLRRPEWGACVCKGTGKSAKGGKCGECDGKGRKTMHDHRHAHLLMAKRLLRNLWLAWTKTPLLASAAA